MNKIILFFIFLFSLSATYAFTDTARHPEPPLQRRIFHDKIDQAQRELDKADGKQDMLINVSISDEVNLQVTDILTRRINDLQDFVELSDKIVGNNEKVRNLTYIIKVLDYSRVAWKTRRLSPLNFPTLIDHFEKILKANLDSETIAPYISECPYDVADILTSIFTESKGYKEAQQIVFLKYAALHPDRIMKSIRPYVGEPFADSLITEISKVNPVQIYSYAQASESPEGKLIRRNQDPAVRKLVELSETPNALYYFPFLDDILSGKQSMDYIRQFIGDGESSYDSVGYFKLLVKTEINYYQRLVAKDTPIAMFGVNGLRYTLQSRAIRHFITPINELHEQPVNIRMKAISPLSPEEIYYMIVMGEDDIYTSSYKHSFAQMIQKMGAKPRADSLLLNVGFDYFKKFIKMAANFNQLDTFLRMMPQAYSEILMKAFVAKLDNVSDLEDAVDVADSYSSIKDKALLKKILNNIITNERKCISDNNIKGKVIYGLLKTIFLSLDSAKKIDLAKEIGIPPIFTVDPNYIEDDSGRIIQQVYFYGDDDGKNNFNKFLYTFSPKEWKITKMPEWVEIQSLKGKQQVLIYANKPLDNDANLDDSAQVHLGAYLTKNNISPTVVIHRGHSYWLSRTISRMPADVKVLVLGSCGGFKNLNQILSICPDAHIISTKEIGKGDINQPILDYLNRAFVSGKKLDWREMWKYLDSFFARDPNREVRESWEDYVPPYKNLGAVFIKAYNKKMENE